MTKATIKASLDVTETKSAVLGDKPEWSAIMEAFIGLSEGTTADKIDLVYMAERTVSDGANDDIDLAGELTSPLEVSIAAAEIVALFVINRQRDGTANTTALTIGAAASNPWTGILGASDEIGPLQPGGVVMIAAGHASGIGSVVADTGDILRIANAAGADNTYQIAILARTA